MKNFKNVQKLDKQAQKEIKGGRWGRCDRPDMRFCEPGICVPYGWQCP